MKKYYLISFMILSSAIAMESPIQPTQDEYELFKVVKKLREIAHESREEIRRTLGFADERQISQLPPKKHRGKTEKGLFIEMSDFPEVVYTPWGYIEIVAQVSHRSDYRASLAAAQLFFKRVNATVHGFTGFSKKFNELIEPVSAHTQLEEALKTISKSELDSYIGNSKLLIRRKSGNHILYRVTQADAQKVPESHLYNYTLKRHKSKISAQLWQLMENRYEREKKS